MQNILITTQGIKKNLRGIKPLDSICEYIWNGFDAEASEVRIKFHENALGLVDMVEIIDNGLGICYEELSAKFQKYNDSLKYSSDQITSLPRGRRGIGRLTFFVFAGKCRWETVYQKDDKHYEYCINMDRDMLNQYDDNGGRAPKETTKETGTLVRITQMEALNKDEVVQRIKEEFFWFLELYRNRSFRIIVDDSEITYEDIVIKRILLDVSKQKLTHAYNVRFVHWNKKLGQEYSRIYFIGSDGRERCKETTKLNRKADQFFHSVYIESDYFDNFYWQQSEVEGQNALFPNKTEEEYKKLLEYVNDYLLDYRKGYLKEVSGEYINKLNEEDIYPTFDDGPLGQYQKEELDAVVGALYVAQPKVFMGLNDDNKRILIRMINLIIENGNKPELFEILKQVIELSDDEMKELCDILQYTSLNRITKTIQLLADRQKVIQSLKEIVFSDDFNSYEAHIQKIVEEHYWIFGEQYNLITSAEPDFEQALRGLIKTTVGNDEKISIDHPDKNKEMDIYMIRQDRKGVLTENVVVELKRPSVRLGEQEVSQIKRYMRVIKAEPRFNAGNVKWTFILVGNEFDGSGSIEGELVGHKSNGQQFLIHTQDEGLTNVYVMKWSEVFDGLLRRHDFLMEKLKFEQSLWLQKHGTPEDAVEETQNNSAKMPEAVVPKRKNK